MSKEIVLSVNDDPKSAKYFVWGMDQIEADEIKHAIGEHDDQYPLLATLCDYHQDFLCEEDRLIALAQETVDLQIYLEEKRRDTPLMVKLLTMVGGLAALGHDHKLGVYAYSG